LTGNATKYFWIMDKSWLSYNLTKWLSMPEIQSQIFLVVFENVEYKWHCGSKGKKRTEKNREYKRNPLMRILSSRSFFLQLYVFESWFFPKIYILKKKGPRAIKENSIFIICLLHNKIMPIHLKAKGLLNLQKETPQFVQGLHDNLIISNINIV
jgi:hypothetical protein